MAKSSKALVDIGEIRRLKHDHYCMGIDRYVGLSDREALARLNMRLTDDVRSHFTGFEPLIGKEAVAKFFEVEVQRYFRWCMHRVFNEVIDVVGDEAKGQWYFDCPVVFRQGNPVGANGAGLIMGRYEERFRRESGIWKWSEIVVFMEVFKPLDAPWNDAKFVAAN